MEALGIDIGGSGIKGALVDTLTGNLLTERHRIPTPSPATPERVAEVVAQIQQFFNFNATIGCGFPALIKNGVAKTASNIDKQWIDTNVELLFEKHTNCKVKVLNDADAAGIAEMKFGAGKDVKGTVIIVTVGTGIGTALFSDGILFPATELGHLHLSDGTIAEHFASDAVRNNLNLSWEQWAERFNIYLKLLDKFFSPQLIILGGGASKRTDKFLHLLTKSINIVPAQLLNEAGIIGAALSTL